ncbi:MAG: hypothetical protein JRN37_10525 [Nitrososphaerota archaeon]|nr:hypothetical protein [Nitrososphaerota archaeon]
MAAIEHGAAANGFIVQAAGTIAVVHKGAGGIICAGVKTSAFGHQLGRLFNGID